MTINVLGVNHKSAPIDIREKLVFDKHSIPKALEDIKNINALFTKKNSKRITDYIVDKNNSVEDKKKLTSILHRQYVDD